MGLRNKVLEGLECCARRKDTDVDYCDKCPYFSGCNTEFGAFAELASDALALLKAQEPRVMTLDEVKQHNNQNGCVWFEQPTYNADAAFAIQDEECTEIISPYILGEPINHGYWSNSNYNVTWRCWTSRPDEKRRVETPWNAQDQREYEAAVEIVEYCERYEPTYNVDDGSM